MNEFIDSIRRLFGFPDSNGLKFSIEHLKSVSHQELLHQPLEYQSKYADAVTIHAVKSGADLKRFVSGRPHYPLNTTAIGNAAYLILYSNDLVVSDTCRRVLHDYGVYLTNR